MPINPRFLQARATERQFRDLQHLGVLTWVPLRRGGKLFARTPLVPLTLRHQLQFRIDGNAFYALRPILLGDVFQILWRLHPRYQPVRAGRERMVTNHAARAGKLLRLWMATGSFPAALAHRRLSRWVARCELEPVIAAVHEFLERTDQDQTGEETTGDAQSRRYRSPISPDRQPADNLVDYLMTAYRLSHAEALDFPIALGNQLYRERLLQQPEGELQIFAPSDRLLSA